MMEDIVSRYLRDYRMGIMGISMIAIMLFHQRFASGPFFNFFYSHGYMGVDVFLFLSGMGMVRSLRQNNLKDFYWRRFYRIVPSCFICGIFKSSTFIFLVFFFPEIDSCVHFNYLSLFSLDLWFIPTIILFYTFSPVLFLCLKRNMIASVTIILLLFFINGFLVRPEVGDKWNSLLGICSWSLERLPVFVFGMITSYKEIYKDKKAFHISIFFATLALVIVRFKVSGLFQINFDPFLFLFVGIGALGIVEMLLLLMNYLPNRIRQLFDFVGVSSLEIYLLHEYIFKIFEVETLGLYSSILLLVVAMAFSFFVAFMCKKSVELMRIK